MRFFIDTEFNDLELISIGVVTETGREFYLENAEFDPTTAGEWVTEHVLPYLTGQKASLAEIRDQFGEFVEIYCKGPYPSTLPEFWGDYCAYDYVIISRLFGSLDNWPEDWPYWFNDIRQYAQHLSIDVPEYPSNHNALEDARGIKQSYEYLIAAEMRRRW